ncbi:MAG TPA: hypothetical protein PKM88_12210, partial [bacterium]|nr:hypothetical protein [bacterium]
TQVRKDLAVTYANNGETHRATATAAFVSAGDVQLLDHADGELFLAQPELRFLTYFVTAPSLSCNGAAVTGELAAAEPLTGATAQVLRFSPVLQPGKNQLTVAWQDAAGAARTKQLTLVYAPDGKLKVGDAVPFGYGRVGSRSGPFYQLATEDSTVVAFGDDQQDFRFPQITDGQLTFGSRLRETVTATGPGVARVQIMKSRYFLMPYDPEDTVVLTVAP